MGKHPIDCGKIGTTRGVLTAGGGVPIDLAVEGANRHHFKMARATITKYPDRTAGAHLRPPKEMCLEKGDDVDEVRDLLAEFGFTAHIRAQGEEAKALKQERGFKARR